MEICRSRSVLKGGGVVTLSVNFKRKGRHRDGHGLGPSMGWVGLSRFFGACRWLGELGPINVR